MSLSPRAHRSHPPRLILDSAEMGCSKYSIYYYYYLAVSVCVCARERERERGEWGGGDYVYSRALGQSRILVCTGERTPVCPWGELEFQFTLRNSSSYGDSSLSFCKLEFQFILGRSEILLDFSLYCYMYRERERGQ